MKLSATAKPKNQTGCPDTWIYNLEAEVTGASSPKNLVWNKSCSTGATMPPGPDVKADLFYIAVTDTLTGCYAEQWIDKRYIPVKIDDDPRDCVANLIVSGGQGPYTYKWVWNGGSTTVAGPLDMNDKLA
ncbi:MAG: hypothetical protein IPL27_11690 [Lewinellaceae bacterium]|nr:hypothetical protein [Lewinellaceae bacterium]